MNPIHSEYVIEKEQLPVDLVLADGEGLHGLLFVPPSWRRPSVEFDAPSILRLSDPFFPIQLPDGGTRLVAKSQVMLMRGEAGDPAGSEDETGDREPVVIWCRHGAVVQGRLLVTRRAPNTRVLDFLNHDVDEFLTVYEERTTVLVNRRHITMVRDDSDVAA